jgi:hypothetical protein
MSKATTPRPKTGKVWECLSSSGTHTLHWWLAEWVAGEVKLDPREVKEAQWLTPGEILGLENTFKKDREFFEKVLPRL